MQFFRISSKHFLRILLLGIEVIAVSELEELQVGILAVGIVLDTFQTAEQQGCTHYVQVVAQRIHQVDKIFRLVGFQSVVIGSGCQRIVQYLIETAANELFGYEVLKFNRLVYVAFYAQA